MKPEEVAEYLNVDRLNPAYANAVRDLIAERDRLRAALVGLQKAAETVIAGANGGTSNFLPGQLRDWTRADAKARAALEPSQ